MEKVSSGKGGSFKNYKPKFKPQKKKIEKKKIEKKKIEFIPTPYIIPTGIKKVFGMATVPSREKSLKRVVDSLINQVDVGYIILNNYNKIPEYLLEYKNLKIYLSKDIGDLKATSKFYPLIDIKEKVYYLSCDDDFIYPPNYVNYMIKKCIELNSVVSQHGCRFLRFPIRNVFFKDITTKGTSNLEKRIRDTLVPFGGTGVMCFDTDLINFNNKLELLNCFKTNRVVDAWFGILCHKKNVSIYVVRSDEKIIYIHYKNNIYKSLRLKKTKEINAINAVVKKAVNETFIVKNS